MLSNGIYYRPVDIVQLTHAQIIEQKWIRQQKKIRNILLLTILLQIGIGGGLIGAYLYL